MDGGKLLYVLDGEPSHDEAYGCLEMFHRLGFTEIIVLGGTEALRCKWPPSVNDALQLRAESIPGGGKGLARAVLDRTVSESVSIVIVAMTAEKQARFPHTVTRKVLLSSTAPVLVLPLSGEPYRLNEASVFSHIVFATNWSQTCEKAFQYLLQFKSAINALEVVNVLNSKLSVREMRGVKERLTETRAKFVNQGIDAEFHVYAGKRFREIALAASDYGASCIVMGGNGKGVFRRITARDCASQVVKHSQLPVLVVR
jgi:nucleotide-binding universal stress UspA family protein